MKIAIIGMVEHALAVTIFKSSIINEIFCILEMRELRKLQLM